jgi:hypothetical protein
LFSIVEQNNNGMKAKDLKYNQEIVLNGKRIVRLDMVHGDFPNHVVYELNEMELINVDPNIDLNELYKKKEELKTKGSSNNDSYKDRINFYMNNVSFQTR